MGSEGLDTRGDPGERLVERMGGATPGGIRDRPVKALHVVDERPELLVGMSHTVTMRSGCSVT
jgi:hypothetical protein